MSQREFYIDRLRTVMTAQVILHHCAITYGADGGWFWRERHADGAPSSVLLTMLTGTQQAYFMGFFFLLAAYFTPASYDRKGPVRFLSDRLCRLGLPLLSFIFLLGPLTIGISEVANGDSFMGGFLWAYQHHRVINGPLWFAEALLIFALAYSGWRLLKKDPVSEPRPVPGVGWWILSAIAVGTTAFLIRLVVPTGENVFGLQLGYFASYVALFALGVAAYRYDWFRQLSWRVARWPVLISLLAWPVLWVSGLVARSLHPGAKLNFSGGFGWLAALYAFWEPLVAWGLIAALLLLFRRYFNAPSQVWDWLGRRAYAVYFIHPPVLVATALLLHGWSAPALGKFVVTGSLSCVACWLLADLLLRVPGAKMVF